MSLSCRNCGATFDSDDDDPRCPKCLRKSSVVDPSSPRDAPMGGSGEAPDKPFWPRFAAAFPSCCLLFFGVTFTMSFGDIHLSWPLRIYATLLGGLMLSVTITVFQMPGLFAPFGPRPPRSRK